MSGLILAIDPGTEQSAWLTYENGAPKGFGIADNMDVLERLRRTQSRVVIEMIASYGMAVGRETFETCVWIGRFIQARAGGHLKGWHLLYRRDVKLHLCNSARAKDANIRQALIDRFGGSKAKAVGTKKNPGPLYGIRRDVWAALAVAVTFADRGSDA